MLFSKIQINLLLFAFLTSVPLSSCSMDFPWTNKEPQPLAQPLPVDDKPKRLAIGGTSVVGVKADGTVWSWGVSSYGELGDGLSGSRQATPTQLPNMTDFIEVATGGDHYLALRKDGTVWSWGDNRCGQLGYETEPEMSPNPALGLTGNNYSTTPKQIKELKKIISIAAGSSYSVALTENGDVYTFGCNDGGQLGLGYADETKNNKKVRYVVPHKVGNIPDGIKVDASASNFIILNNRKEIWLAGYIVLKDSKTTYNIKKTKLEIPFLLVESLPNYDGMIILRDNGFLYKISFDKYINDKIYVSIDEFLNRGKSILSVKKSIKGFLFLNNDYDVFHIYQDSQWSISHLENILELYSTGGTFSAFTKNGSVYFWGRYHYGLRGLGVDQDLTDTPPLIIGTKRFKTPELSLWRWK